MLHSSSGYGTGKPGLFGYCTAYYGMTEVQGGGVLHLHALFWIAGAPTTITETIKNITEAWNDKVIKYTQSIVSNNLPNNIMSTGCNCGASYDKLVKIPRTIGMLIPKFCYQRNTEFKEPALASCSICHSKCSPQHLNRKWIIYNFPPYWPPLLQNIEYTVEEENRRKLFSMKLISEFKRYDQPIKSYVPDAEDILKTNDFFLQILTMPVSKEDLLYDINTRELILSYLVLTNNMHWYYHCHSCIKGGKTKKICRYDYPKPPNLNAIIKTDEILLQRSIGSEYINGYNDILMNVFKCNHDIKVMIGGSEMSERIYYCCKYITKSQNSIESTAAISIAFDKRLQKEEKENSDMTDIQKSRRRMASIMLQLSNGSMEISGTLSALYVLRRSCAYKSDDYKFINLRQYYEWMTQSDANETEITHEIEVPSIQDINENETDTIYNVSLEETLTFTFANNVHDYIYRPKLYENYSIYWFCAHFYRTYKSKFNSSISNTSKEFLDGHPLKSTHALAQYQKGNYKIPVIYSSMKVPDYEKCDTEELKTIHAQRALLLFRPFRSVSDIKPEDVSWDEAFRLWKEENIINDKLTDSLKIYTNMQDFYVGRRLASETQKERYKHYLYIV
jgi:hypothetical protein